MTKPRRQVKNADRQKKLIIFDLDGVLTETKSVMDQEMAELFCFLLARKKVAVIGGGKHTLFKEQLIRRLRCPRELWANLFLFPTTATIFYRFNRGWKKVYEEKLSGEERTAIKKAFRKAFKELHYQKPEKTYGRVIEDRGTQVTFSALGQEVVKILGEEGVGLKKEWRDKNTDFKLKLAKTLQKLLPKLEVRAAGYTSVDVTRRGIDKAYGIRQIKKHLGFSIKEMLFVGDALFPGGNDFAVLRTGVDCLAVSGPAEVKKIIRFLLDRPVKN